MPRTRWFRVVVVASVVLSMLLLDVAQAVPPRSSLPIAGRPAPGVAGLNQAPFSNAVASTSFSALDTWPLCSGTSASPCALAASVGITPLPPQTDLAGEILPFGPGLAVNTGSGALDYEGVSLSIPSRGPAFEASLSYNSLYREHDKGWGYGWIFDWDWSYQVEGSDPLTVTVLLGWGGYEFAGDGQEGFVSSSKGVTLTQPVSGTLVLSWSDGQEIHFESPAHKRATRWLDADGRSLSFAYNGDGSLATVADNAGRQMTFTWDGGRLATIADLQSTPPRWLQLGYGPAGDLASVGDALGNTAALAYDAGHRLVLVTGPRGGQTAIGYSGDYVTQVERGDLTTHLIVDEGQDTITVREEGDGDLREQVYAYAPGGVLERVTYPGGASSAQRWDEVQRQWITTDENGQATVLSFDAENRLAASRDPLGHTTTFGYDPDRNRISTVTDPNGHTTAFAYDEADRLNAIVDPLGRRWSYANNDSGEMVGITDPLSYTALFSYDDQGLPAVITNPLGIATLLVHDDAGNQISITGGNGHATAFAYDALGQVTVMTDALGYAITMAYDANGNLVSAIDANGQTTRAAYDELDRRLVITDALSGQVGFAYDAWGNLAALTDAAGHATHYAYDARDRMTLQTDPLGQATAYHYDPAGNVVGSTDASGQVITYTYNAAGLLTRADYAGDDDRYFFYDPAGQRTAAGDADLEIDYAYDAAGQLASVVYGYDGVAFPSLELLYGYDAARRLISATLPSGERVGYEYDAAGRLAVVEGGGTRHELAYDDGDRLTGLQPAAGQPGVQVALGYDAADRMTTLANASSDGSVAFDAFSYAYDPAGHVLTATHDGGVTGYAYDALYRLTEVANPGARWERYAYDAVGNRLELQSPAGTVAYAYDAAGQMRVMTDTRDGPPAFTTFTYDQNGNMRTRTSGGQTTTYTWDAAGLLRRVDLADGTYVAYTYGPEGQRLSRQGRDGEVVYYVYDQLNLVEERDGAGNVLASYVHGIELDRPYSMARGGQTYFFLYDRLGSVVGLSDGGGNVVARYAYDAWGNLTGETGTAENPFRFTGREWDAEVGLYHLRARYYDPALGRFISRDPLGAVDGTNRYAYAGNDPVNYVDSLGTSRMENGEECQGRCKCFNDCFDAEMNSKLNNYLGLASAALNLTNLARTLVSKVGARQALTALGIRDPQRTAAYAESLWDFTERSFGMADSLRKILGALNINLTDNNCVAMGITLAMEAVFSVVSVAGAIGGTVAGCAAAVASLGIGAGACALALANGAVTGAQVGVLTAAVTNCAQDSDRCVDRTAPVVTRIGYEDPCDVYDIQASDNCEPLAKDPTGRYTAQVEIQIVVAQDKEGNTSQGVIPVCKPSCQAKPECSGSCTSPVWHQESCNWSCDIILGDPPACKLCSQPSRDLERCQWTCKAIFPPAPKCEGTDECGNSRKPEWDMERCAWACVTTGNNPCNPDDTRSPAGVEVLPQAGTCGVSTVAPGGGRIAILGNGYAATLQNFLASLGVVADRVPPGFAPEMVDRYPALFIPSGGLAGYDTSDLMAQRLARYAENGGLIVSFAQEYGDDLRLLPGGEVGGYGWDEDLNCHADSAYLSAFAPPLAGQTAELLSLNIDGFFTGWPEEAAVLLDRRANGLPAMLTYPYGAGRVLATTAYADMARYQGQGTTEEEILVRDLARWALSGELDMDAFGPGDVVTAVVTVTNGTGAPLAQVGYGLYGPWNHLALTGAQVLPAPLDPGASTHITLTLDLAGLALPEAERYGLWSVGVWPDLSGLGKPDRSLGSYWFAVTVFTAEEGGHRYRGQPYALTVTSETETYTYGTPAVFTYLVANRSVREETFRVTWYMIHHSWYSVPGHRGEKWLTVPAGGTGVLSSTLEEVVDLDRVRATLYLPGTGDVAYAERGFWVVPARLSQQVTLGQTTYDWFDTPVVTTTVHSLSDERLDLTADLELRLPGGDGLPLDTRSFSLAPGITTTYAVTLPPLVHSGHHRVELRTGVGSGRANYLSLASLYVLPPEASVALELPGKVTAGAPLTATVTNAGGSSLPATTLQVTLTNPAGTPLWSDMAGLPLLAPGAMATSTFSLGDPGPVVLGDYGLDHQLEFDGGGLETGRIALPAQLSLEGAFDHEAYRVRDTLRFTATVSNRGILDLAPAMTVTLPALGLTRTQAISLTVGASATVVISAGLPVGMAAGSYDVQVSAVQGATASRFFPFVVPPAAFEANLAPGPYQAGQPLTVTLDNVGGVDSIEDYRLWLVGPTGVVTQGSGTVAVQAGAAAAIPWTMPAQLAGGAGYVLQYTARDLAGGWSDSWVWPLAVEGVEAALAARTSQDHYLAGDTVAITGAVTVTAGSLVSAPLELTISNDAPGEGWQASPNVRVDDYQGNWANQAAPDVAMDAAGNAYAVWADCRDGGQYCQPRGIYFAYRPAGGSWSANEQVDDNHAVVSWFPAIAVDGGGNAYAVWWDERDGDNGIYFAYRPAGGAWSANERVNGSTGPLRPTAADERPAIRVDAAGNAYALWADWRNGDSDVYFAYRPAGGNWGADERVNDDGGTYEQSQPDLAVDAAGNAYAVWKDERLTQGQTDIAFAYRPAGGPWGSNVLINDDGTGANQWDPAIAVDAAGIAYAVWEDMREGYDKIYSATRPAAGPWGPNQPIESGEAYQSHPDVAASASGDVYAVWEQWPGDIRAAHRPVGGTWSVPSVLNDDDPLAGFGHWQPAIAVDGGGNATAIWHDERNGTAARDDADIYSAHRPAGGSWGTNQRVDDFGNAANQVYPDVAVDAAGNAYAVWADSRDRQPDVYFAYRPAGGSWGASERVNDFDISGWDPVSYGWPRPAIAVDPAGNAYAVWRDLRNGYPDIYFAHRPAGGAWGTNERVCDVPSHYEEMPDIAVDAIGNAYVVWRDQRSGAYGKYEIFFVYRPWGGSWGASVQVNDVMSSLWSPAIAVDAAGNAHAAWVDGREGAYAIYSAYRPAGGNWGANVRVNSVALTSYAYGPSIAANAGGTVSAVWDGTGKMAFATRQAGGAWSANEQIVDSQGYSPKIAIDVRDNAYVVWWDYRTAGVPRHYFAYRSAGGVWEPSVQVVDNTGKPQEGGAVAVDSSGTAFVIWEDTRNGDSDIYFATVGQSGGGVVWSRDLEVTATTTWPIDDSAGTLGGTPGRYRLEATLSNDLGQTLARDGNTFYIHPAGVALTLDTDRDAYRPGQTVLVSGWVTNTAVLTDTLTLAVTAGDETLLSQVLDLGPGQGVAYSTSFTASADLLLTATAGAAEVVQQVAVASPQVDATLEAPPVVGTQPFSATLAVTNTGPLSATLEARFACPGCSPAEVTRTAMLEGGQRAWLAASLAAAQDTLLTATLSGDVSLTVTQAITYGEVVSLSWDAPAAVWAGAQAVPYTLTNAGLLPATTALTFTLDGSDVLSGSVTTLAGQVHAAELWLDVAPGSHTLTATAAHQQLAATWIAYAPGAQAVRLDEVQAPAFLAGQAPLTATLTNVGPGRVAGTVQAATSFFLAEVRFDLAPGATASLTATLDSQGAPAGGAYTLTVTALANGTMLDQVDHSLQVLERDLWADGPDLVIVPGQENTVLVTVHNDGGLGVPFTHTLDLDGLYVGEQRGWAGPGEAVTLTYTLTLPADVEARTGVGHHQVDGLRTPFTYTIAGYQLDMHGWLAPHVARPGQAVTATIQISDTSGLGAPIPLVVRLAGAGIPLTRTITLSHTAVVTFALTAPGESVLLSYGLYHPDGRSLLLDTLRLYVDGDLVLVHPDRDRYRPGETVQLTAMAVTTSTLAWSTLGYSGSLTMTPSISVTFPVALPADLAAGSYHASYLLEAGEYLWEQGEVSFEVDGDRISVRKVTLDWSTVGELVVVDADLRLQSASALDAVEVLIQVFAPDGALAAESTGAADVLAGTSWVSAPQLSFTPHQAGTYSLYFQLSQGGRQMSSGWQFFDLPGPVILGVRVPLAYTLTTQPASAGVALLADGTPPHTLTLTLDGLLVAEQALAATGYQMETFDLGLLSQGTHRLTARLTDSRGRYGQGTAAIEVMELGLDLQVSEPDGLDGWHVTTPTIWLWPQIEDSTAHYAWDGGEPREAANNQADIPADGQHELAAWAQLPQGEAGPVVPATLKLDRLAPRVEAVVATGTPVTVSLVASDSTSGAGWLGYWGQNDWLTYTAPLAFASVQTTTLIYQARDRAGNESATGEVEVPPVDQPYGLALWSAPGAQDGPPGAAVAHTLRLTNTGVVVDTYQVTVTGGAWPARGPSQVGPLEAGRGAALVVVVDIPAGSAAGANDVTSAVVASAGAPSQSEERLLTTVSNVVHGVDLQTGRSERTGARGGEVLYRLRVSNLGNVADTFGLAVVGSNWPVAAPASVGPLAPGGYADVTLVVSIPGSARAGQQDTANVTVTSWADPAQKDGLVLTTRVVLLYQVYDVYLPLVLRNR